MLHHVDALIAFTGIILLASLIVMVITQIFTVLCNLRGRNLLWGMSRLLSQIDPDLKDEAEKIAKKILENPLISKFKLKNKIRLPNVIRVEEFSRLLIRMVENDEMCVEEKGKKVEFKSETKAALKNLIKIDQDEFALILDNLPVKLKKASKEIFEKAQQEILNLLKKARKKLNELEYWFDKTTDRISEKFSFKSKSISVAAAVFVAVFFQLDSISIMKKLYADSDLRATIIAQSDFLTEKGAALIKKETYFNLAVDNLLENTKYKDMNKRGTESFSNRIAAERWLGENTPKNYDKEKKEKLLQDFRHIFLKNSEEELKQLEMQFTELNESLSKIQLKIFGELSDWNLNELPKKIPGILITIALLSLGAPFWFNVLKNLTNLRTRLMSAEEKERKDRQKNST